MYHRDLLAQACQRYGVTLGEVTDLPLAGSPARSRFRVVVSDLGRRYVLEEIAADAAERRERLALLLHRLAVRGLPVLPYRPRSDGRGHVARVGRVAAAGPLWMLSPYLQGVPLPRPGWVHDGTLGAAMGVFLRSFRRASPDLAGGPAWDLRRFVEGLAATMARHRPDLLPRAEPALAVVRSQLSPALPRLPLALCHGDYHPLNVIWRANPPREATGTPQVGTPVLGTPVLGTPVLGAVIDWEFSGAKPALYDVALLIGCVGIEQPEALDGAFCQRLLAAAGAHGLGDEPSWTTLVPLVIATRLAWLSEWLRSRDREMISTELAYLDLLVASLEPLGATWRRLADSSDGVRGARWEAIDLVTRRL